MANSSSSMNSAKSSCLRYVYQLFPQKRQRNHECIYRSRVRTRKYTTARAAALQCTHKPLYPCHGHSGLLHEYNLRNPHPNMSEHKADSDKVFSVPCRRTWIKDLTGFLSLATTFANSDLQPTQSTDALSTSHSSPNNQDLSMLLKSVTEKLNAGYFSKYNIIPTSVKNCTRIDCNSILTVMEV